VAALFTPILRYQTSFKDLSNYMDDEVFITLIVKSSALKHMTDILLSRFTFRYLLVINVFNLKNIGIQGETID